jgi:hypothetical protein
MHPAVMMARDPQGGLRDPFMRITLLAAAVAFLLVYAWLLVVRLRTLRVADGIAELARERDLALS